MVFGSLEESQGGPTRSVQGAEEVKSNIFGKSSYPPFVLCIVY